MEQQKEVLKDLQFNTRTEMKEILERHKPQMIEVLESTDAIQLRDRLFRVEEDGEICMCAQGVILDSLGFQPGWSQVSGMRILKRGQISYSAASDIMEIPEINFLKPLSSVQRSDFQSLAQIRFDDYADKERRAELVNEWTRQVSEARARPMPKYPDFAGQPDLYFYLTALIMSYMDGAFSKQSSIFTMASRQTKKYPEEFAKLHGLVDCSFARMDERNNQLTVRATVSIINDRLRFTFKEIAAILKYCW